MSTDIHQFRRQNSECAVIGGEGLVQLGHLAADAGQAFHQVHFESHLGEIQGSLNARYAATYYQYIPIHG
jgi:hypothetical protein